MNKLIILLFGMILLYGCSSVNEKNESRIDLNGILEQYANEKYELNPLSATANNVNTYNDQLAIDISDEHIKKAIALNNSYLDTLALINYDSLTESEQLSVGVLKEELSLSN